MVFLRLIRLPNLLVIALTQWLVYDHVLGQAFSRYGISPNLAFHHFVSLVVATCAVTAAGYIFNDICDSKIDQINRPAHKVLVGRLISYRSAQWLCFCFLVAGFILSIFLALAQQVLPLLWLFPFSILLLGAYPYYLKTQPFSGNVMVSLMCAAVPLLILLAEWGKWKILRGLDANLAGQILGLLVLFGSFAFLVSYIRELVKDLQDVKGDKYWGRTTFPVQFGITKTKYLIFILAAILSPLLFLPITFYPASFMTGFGVGFTIVLLFALLSITFFVYQAYSKESYGRVSTLLKVFMLAGLALLAFYQI